MPKKLYQGLLTVMEDESYIPTFGDRMKKERSIVLTKKGFKKMVGEVEEGVTKSPKIYETRKILLVNQFEKFEDWINEKFDREETDSEDEEEEKKEENNSTQEIEDSECEEDSERKGRQKGEKQKKRKRSISKEEKKEEKKAKKDEKETEKKEKRNKLPRKLSAIP